MLFNDVSPGRPVWSAGGGVLVYRPHNENRRLVWVSRNGTEVSVPSPPKRYSAPSLSPPGDRVALEIDDAGKFDIWMLDIERQSLTRLTSDGASRYPMWTPDGTHVGLAQRREDSVFLVPASGGESQALVRSKTGSWIGSWTPDMRRHSYTCRRIRSRGVISGWSISRRKRRRVPSFGPKLWSTAAGSRQTAVGWRISPTRTVRTTSSCISRR